MSGLTTQEVRVRLKVRFGRRTGQSVPEHAVLFEVPIDGVRTDKAPNGVEYPRKVRQRIDAVAVGLWARTEHRVHGFEIKCSRSDLLAELRDPEKAAAGVRLCDRWWLVLGHPDLLRDGDELPDGWGVLVPRGRGLGILVEAKPSDSVADPRFVAALVQSTLTARGTVARGLGHVDGYVSGFAEARKRYERRRLVP